jgi:predicted DNA-binding antitoxin AbrB/MazE fold protein
MTIPAKYESGVFRPLEDVQIKEGTVVEVHVPVEKNAAPRGKRSLKDLAAYGMWKDREDMADSVDYVSSLRRNLRA